MSKQRESKLDQYAETLLDMDDQKKTLDEILAWLKDEGISVARSTLSRFLDSLRQSRLQDRLLTQIATGGRMNRELDAAYERNPAPEIETLIKVTKTLIASLQVKGATDEKFLSLANSMQQTVLNFVSGKTKAALEERKLNIAERRVSIMEKKASAYDRAQAALEKAKSSKGGITPETLRQIETELKLL